MGAEYAGVLSGITLIVIGIIEGIIGVVFVGAGLTCLSVLFLIIGGRRGWH
jgi:hypothetical protein